MSGKIDISPEQLAIVQGILKDHLPKGTLAWAFGSRVTWTAKPFSDLDIALEAAAPLPSDVLIDLEEAFEASDLPWTVDIIDLNAVSPEFRAIVERQRVPGDWEDVLLGEVAKELTVGHVGSMAEEYLPSGIPFLRSLNILPHRITTDEIRYISPEFHARLKKSALKPGDVVIVSTGKPGTCAVIPDWLEEANCSDLVIARTGPRIRPRYLAYWVNSLASHHIGSSLVGAVQQHFNVGAARKMPVLLPPIVEQDAILEAVGTLDDKIELNRRTNDTLEAMARAVFRDWFVDFGPTRRKAEGLTDPAAILGHLLPNPEKSAPLAALFPDRFANNGLPEGWEERAIADDFDVEMGQSPPGSTYNETGDGLPFFQGRRDFQFRFPEKRVYCSAPSRIAQADWTLISVRAPVGDINRAWEKCCIGRGVGAMMHKQGWASFTYYVGLHLQTELASYDKDGTVFGSINQKQLKGLSLIGTNSNAAKAFDDLIAPMDAMIRNNIAENQTLASTRDLLLPKLMSGELRLTGAEGVV